MLTNRFIFIIIFAAVNNMSIDFTKLYLCVDCITFPFHMIIEKNKREDVASVEFERKLSHIIVVC